MSRRTLPLADRIERTPTVDAIRTRLGGRAASRDGIGRLVSLAHQGRNATGVALFVDDSTIDVWLGDNIVRRVAIDDASTFDGIADPAMHAVAADAQRFARIAEGAIVSFRGRGDVQETGTLVEKCRFGGLVARGDGSIVGVGFRALVALPAN